MGCCTSLPISEQFAGVLLLIDYLFLLLYIRMYCRVVRSLAEACTLTADINRGGQDVLRALTHAACLYIELWWGGV
jgi:hypothetical protein